MAGYSLTAFAPAFLMRARGMSSRRSRRSVRVTSGLTGILGLLLVGRLADRLSSNDFRWLLWLVAAMTATMIPFSAMAFVVDNRSLAVLFISLSYVVGTAYMAPSIAAIQRLARAEQRATASAIFLFFSAVVGSAGPFLTGVISDALRPDLGNMALGRALLIVPVMQLLAVACYVVASRRFLREIVDEPAGSALASLLGVDDPLRRHRPRRRRPFSACGRERNAVGDVAQRVDHLAQRDDGLAASIVGSNASSPGVSRLSVSATVNCSSGPFLAVRVSITRLRPAADPRRHPRPAQLDQPSSASNRSTRPPGSMARINPLFSCVAGPAHRPAWSACPPVRPAAATGPPGRPAPAPGPAAGPCPSAWPACWPVQRRRRCPAFARPILVLIWPGPPRCWRCRGRHLRRRGRRVRAAASVSVLPRFMWLSLWAYAQRARTAVVPGNQTHRKLTGFMQHYSK